MKKRDKCFVVPGAFVPYNDTVTLLTYNRLRKLDFDFDVFAFRGKEDKTIKKELNDDPCWSKFNIKYLCNYEDAIAIKHPLRVLKSLYLMNKYVKESLKEFEKKEYNCVYTSSIPGISHICGYRIKKKYPFVKWIASFSDPIKNAPYKKDPDLIHRNIFYRIAFHVGASIYMNDRYEKVAIEKADELFFICEEQRDFTANQYSNKNDIVEKSKIVPLSYNSEWSIYNDISVIKSKKQFPIVAVHLGRIYGLRKIDTFLQALKELKEEDVGLSNKIVFHQYSEIQPYSKKYIKDNNLEDLFVLHEKVEYEDSLQIIKNADVLVLFDTIIEEGIQPYLPSKIVEYKLTNKPILGICKENSPSYKLLKGKWCSYNRIEIKNNILEIINNK